jgi:hypothetical protein
MTVKTGGLSIELESRSMPESKHYRYQADQAKRLASQVSDPQVRVRLLEMADEYSRYASLIEARASEGPMGAATML